MKGKTAETAKGVTLDQIKRVAIAAMFSDDELMDMLVLKGGNAMDIVHRVNSRASVDLDFSTAQDLDMERAHRQIEGALQSTFQSELDYVAFDVNVTQRPGTMPDALAAFWGGYLVDFKLISRKRADELDRDLARMRREAMKLGDEGNKFTVDISRHEYTADKLEKELLGYRIYVYSPAMIVAEKVRAICQQMPEYGEVIQRSGPGKERARDFIDIAVLIDMFKVDLADEHLQEIVRQMFSLKRVPLALIPKIAEVQVRDFHALGFPAVQATVKAGVALEGFDHYHQLVVDQVRKLEPLWHV